MTSYHPFPPARPAELLHYRQHELDELFALLPAPADDQVTGVWRGTLMAIRGLGWLPRGVAAGLYHLLALPLINPWRGKGFVAGAPGQAEGANRWFGMPGLGFGSYRTRFTRSPVDGAAVLWLDYDRPENLAALRGIRGEARLLGDGVLLCRMNWQGRPALHRVLYFTLTRAG